MSAGLDSLGAMLDAAFRQIAGAVSAQFGGPYAAGKLLYPGTPVYDDGGSIITPGTPSEVDCQIQVDVCTESMRLDAGYLSTDVRLVILIDGELDTTPDARVDAGKFAGNTYSLQSADRDTLGFGWQCRARKV
jgi:hypothetical protein